MVEFFQDLLVKSIPFLIPGVLVASWMVNHKSPGSGKSSSDSSSSDKKAKPEKKEESASKDKESKSDS